MEIKKKLSRAEMASKELNSRQAPMNRGNTSISPFSVFLLIPVFFIVTCDYGHRLSAWDLDPRDHYLLSNPIYCSLDGISSWFQKKLGLVFFQPFLSCPHCWRSMLLGHDSISFQCQPIHCMGCLYFTRTIAINFGLHWSFITSVSNTFTCD